MPEENTIGALYGPAMYVKTQADANLMFSQLVQNHVLSANRRGDEMTYSQAEEIVRENLGYYAGYFDDETRERVERLYKTEHPILGAIKKGKPTPSEAFELGIQWAKGNKIKWDGPGTLEKESAKKNGVRRFKLDD